MARVNRPLDKDAVNSLVQKLHRANRAILEARFLISEMHLAIQELYLSIAIPACNFTPSFEKGLRCEPIIELLEGSGRLRCLSLEEFEKDLNEARNSLQNEGTVDRGYLFGMNQPMPVLVGVSNLSLRPLNHDIRFRHAPPIFGTQGTIIGQLNCELRRRSAIDCKCELRIRDITDVSEDGGFDDFVFCQYRLPRDDDYTFALPVKQTRQFCSSDTIPFNHTATFDLVDMSVVDGVLRIEVWTHRRVSLRGDRLGIRETGQTELGVERNLLVQRLSEKWRGLRCLLALSVGLNELDENGMWNPVCRQSCQAAVGCGGYFKLKQGQSHMLTVSVKPIRSSKCLRVRVTDIESVEVGCIRCCKKDCSADLDSYTDKDLLRLRQIWLKLLDERKRTVEAEIRKKESVQRSLLELLCLAEERNLVELPPARSGIPGSPADWDPPNGIEVHTPLLLLDRDEVDIPVYEESDSEFVALRFTPVGDSSASAGWMRARCHWDPAVHESTWLNQISDPNLFVFLLLRIRIGVEVDETDCGTLRRKLVLRKRMPVQIVSRRTGAPTWMQKILSANVANRSMTVDGGSVSQDIGVIYDLAHSVVDFNPAPIEQMARDAAREVVASPHGNASSFVQLQKYLQALQMVDQYLERDQDKQTCSLREVVNSTRTEAQMLNRGSECVSAEPTQDDGSIEWTLAVGNCERSQSISSADSDATLKPEARSIGECNGANGENTCGTALSETSAVCHDPNEEWIANEQRVLVCTNSVNREPGTIKYVGSTAIKKGTWVGICLDRAVGKNDGSYRGKRYFTCNPDHGVFVRPDKLQKMP